MEVSDVMYDLFLLLVEAFLERKRTVHFPLKLANHTHICDLFVCAETLFPSHISVHWFGMVDLRVEECKSKTELVIFKTFNQNPHRMIKNYLCP